MNPTPITTARADFDTQARESMEIAVAMIKSGVRFVPVVVLDEDQAREAKRLSEARLNQALKEAEAEEAARA